MTEGKSMIVRKREVMGGGRIKKNLRRISKGLYSTWLDRGGPYSERSKGLVLLPKSPKVYIQRRRKRPGEFNSKFGSEHGCEDQGKGGEKSST